MATKSSPAAALSRVRWSAGILGLFGLVALAVELSAPRGGPLWRSLCALGVPVLLGQLALAAALPRLRPGPWPLRLSAAFALWALGLTAATAIEGGLGATPPVVLLVLIPGLGSWMRLKDAGPG